MANSLNEETIKKYRELIANKFENYDFLLTIEQDRRAPFKYYKLIITDTLLDEMYNTLYNDCGVDEDVIVEKTTKATEKLLGYDAEDAETFYDNQLMFYKIAVIGISNPFNLQNLLQFVCDIYKNVSNAMLELMEAVLNKE